MPFPASPIECSASGSDFAAVTDARTQSYFGNAAVVTGNPDPARVQDHSAEDFTVAPYTILIFGGSQGAQSINRAVIEAPR